MRNPIPTPEHTTENLVDIIVNALEHEIHQDFVVQFDKADSLDEDVALYDQAGEPLSEVTIYTEDGFVHNLYIDEPTYVPDIWEGMGNEKKIVTYEETIENFDSPDLVNGQTTASLIEEGLKEVLNQPFVCYFSPSEDNKGKNQVVDPGSGEVMSSMTIWTKDGMAQEIYFTEPTEDKNAFDLFQGNENFPRNYTRKFLEPQKEEKKPRLSLVK